MEMKAPTGAEIQGTYEMCPGSASVVFTPGEGQGYDHDGSGTDMHWDGMVTQTIAGTSLFTDENGSDWQQHHLIPDSAEPLSSDTIDAMASDDFLGQALDAANALKSSLQVLAKNRLWGDASPVEPVIEALTTRHAAAKARVLAMMTAELAAQSAVAE